MHPFYVPGQHETNYLIYFNKWINVHTIDVVYIFIEDLLNITAILDKTATMNPLLFLTFTAELGAKTMANPDVARMLGDTEEKFDVVIAEWMFADIYAGYVICLR